MPPSTLSGLREFYAEETEIARRDFDSTGGGAAALLARSSLVDSIVRQLYGDLLSNDLRGPKNFCAIALGGYGRRELFPHSDVDILFLYEEPSLEAAHKETVAEILKTLWDLRLRVSPASRTLEECDEFNGDNPEFTISLLDCRYLAGDERLFARLSSKVIPELVARERSPLVHNLAELTRQRHTKHGNTIFHLEPNLKEAPGGLRDYHVACWLTRIARLEEGGGASSSDGAAPLPLQLSCDRAFEFLSATRCFLHYRQGRDDNILSYELQAEAAAAGIGAQPGIGISPADWMRSYFQHVRSICNLTDQMLEEAASARSSLYELYEDWRSRLSNAEFSVMRGRVFIRQPAALADPGTFLSLFEFRARHGVPLSAEAERHAREAQEKMSGEPFAAPQLWARFRQILVLPHAAGALRDLHRLGTLVRLFPQFHAIDSLVIRDFYHRYTVDEHSFQAIDNLHRLRKPAGEWEHRFSEMFSEIEQPELLFLALLFHDVGKGLPVENHVEGSLGAVSSVFARLALEPADAETVRFLISSHLEMSATLLRRDIFDPETIRSFAEKVGSSERLKLLCLFTYADIRAVNPEALTPWKAEMLWQLYAAATNYLNRSVDEERFLSAATREPSIEQILSLLPAPATAEDVAGFLTGFPKRYLLTRSPQAIAAHYQMMLELRHHPVALKLSERGHFHELTLLAADRPFLFATIAGALSALGMNIVKAEAFSNAGGIVLDSFYFVDLFRTLELNPPEIQRFEKTLVEVLTGRASLEKLLSGRANQRDLPPPKVRLETQIRFDDESSSHSTLLELVAEDRPGLLYQVSSTLAELGCNIEVALIDTEGQKAIDVFYLTARGAKLDPSLQRALRRGLVQRLSSAESEI
jgi:[protein-PII] uridylyltransferase